MPTLDARTFVNADGGGRTEIVTHPESGERVWSCSSCEERGKGDENAAIHARHCNETGYSLGLPHDHFK